MTYVIDLPKDYGKALRFNEGKPQWSLVDFDALLPLVRGLEHGMQKGYPQDNWKKPMDRKVILDSLLRHTLALAGGKEIDPESGLNHISGVLCNALFYSYHYAGLNATGDK